LLLRSSGRGTTVDRMKHSAPAALNPNLPARAAAGDGLLTSQGQRRTCAARLNPRRRGLSSRKPDYKWPFASLRKGDILQRSHAERRRCRRPVLRTDNCSKWEKSNRGLTMSRYRAEGISLRLTIPDPRDETLLSCVFLLTRKKKRQWFVSGIRWSRYTGRRATKSPARALGPKALSRAICNVLVSRGRLIRLGEGLYQIPE
jgi:hypothetical protein